MSMMNIPLFQALGAKMTYNGRYQTVLAENIANADMPGYRAKSLGKVDFGAVLDKTIQSGDSRPAPVRLAATHAGHAGMGDLKQQARTAEARMTYEVAPNDNSVVIEEQMVKAGEIEMDYNLMSNLLRKNIGFIYTALGRNG